MKVYKNKKSFLRVVHDYKFIIPDDKGKKLIQELFFSIGVCWWFSFDREIREVTSFMRVGKDFLTDRLTLYSFDTIEEHNRCSCEIIDFDNLIEVFKGFSEAKSILQKYGYLD